MIDNALSNRLSNMNFVATMLIVIMHVVYAGVSSIFDCTVLNYMTRLAVPIFFAMSGFLLVNSIERNGFRGLFLSRVKSLVVPYFVLNTLFIPYLYVYQNILHAGNWPGEGLTFDWYTISVCAGLWYVRNLLMLLCLSPLLYFAMRGRKLVGLILVALPFVAVLLLQYANLSTLWSSRLYSFFNVIGFGFFLVGMFLAVNYERLRSYKTKRCAMLLLLGILLTALIVTRTILGVKLFGTVEALVAASFLWFAIPNCHLPKWVISSCFAVFAIHPLIFKVYATFLSKVGVSVLSENRLCSLIPFVAALGVCYSLTYLLRNYLPKLGKLMFGGRC